jgi:hypothetical protein
MGRMAIVPLGEDESGLFSDVVRVWMIVLTAFLVAWWWASQRSGVGLLVKFRFIGGMVSASLGLADSQMANMST